MNWPFSRLSKKVEKEYIGVLLLGQTNVRAWLCRVDAQHQHIEFVDEKLFQTSPTWDSLVYDVDNAFFEFEKTHDISIHKATFFVHSHLADQETGDLQEAYIDVLKNVLIENRLESLGYVKIEDSLVAILQEQERTPLNAVMVEVDSSSVLMSVYKGGKRIHSQLKAKSARCVADVEAIIAEMPKNIMLPAKMYLYDTPAVENESHEILTHAWNSPQFIQLPQVSVIKPTDIKSALMHGLSQELFTTIDTFSRRHDEPESAASIVEQTVHEEDDSRHQVLNQDVSVSDVPETPVSTQSVAGFVIGGDVRTDSPSVSTKAVVQPYVVDHVRDAQGYAEMPVQVATHAQPSTDVEEGESWSTKIMRGITTLKLKFMNMKGSLMPAMIGGGIVLVLLSVLGGILYYGHSAQVTLLYAPEEMEKTLSLSDEITLSELTETVSAQAKTSTTGTDDVGERAKGTLTIYNADEKSKSFEKGTKVRTPDGLEYVLDKNVTVEGAKKTVTSDENILTSTAKAQVSATADDIGSKYNIKKDVKLTLEGFSSTTYFAKSETAFEGGSSKQIQTVDADDYAALDKKITADIEEKIQALVGKSYPGQGVVKDLTLIDTSSQTYSAEIGEEADEVSSTVKAKVTLLALTDSQVKKVLLEKLRDDIPDGYVLGTRHVTFRVEKATKSEKTESVELQIRVMARPQKNVEVQKALSVMKGKSVIEAEKRVKESFGVEGIDANITTPLPFLTSRLPFFSSHIAVKLKSL